MRGAVAGICGSALLALSATHVLAGPPPQQEQAPAEAQKPAAAEPKLADIIPRASQLSARLAVLERKARRLPDAAAIDKEFSDSQTRLEAISNRLEKLKGAQVGRYAGYIKLREALENEGVLFEATGKPLVNAVNALDEWDRAWRGERARWTAWQASVLQEQTSAPLRAAFGRAFTTIDAALDLVSQHIERLTAVQARGAEIQVRMDGLATEVRALIAEARQDALLGKSPPMYSALYVSQFRTELWNATWDGLTLLSWPDRRFFTPHALAFSLLLVLFAGITAVIRSNRCALKESPHWGFVADRMIATPVFICALILTALLRLWEAPQVLATLNTTAGGIACVQLLLSVLQQQRVRQAAVGVMSVALVTFALVASGLPVPLFRLYTVVVSAAAFAFCLRWAREVSDRGGARREVWALRLIAALCAVIVLAQILGNAGPATYLFIASLTTMAIVLPVKLFVHMIRGGLHWLFFSSPVWQVRLLREDAKDHARKLGFLIETSIFVFFLLPAVLAVWNVFSSYQEAIRGLLAPAVTIGAQRVSIGLVVAALGTLYGSFLAASIIPRVLLDEQFAGRHMEKGARFSASRLLQYIIALAGFLVALSMLGLNWTNMTIILSAFGVGIGFGLQSIVNNFVSGLILLFERPLREGDTIELPGKERVHIRKIGLRATHVRTFEQAEVVIPNADLVTNPVINWTLVNREVRLSVPVSVSYGSDVRKVGETLLACAAADDTVLKSPAPHVLFMDMGESSLNFELRVWIPDADDRLPVRSRLYEAILERFREAGIEIPFPQRDLHVRSMAESIAGLVQRRPEQEGGKPSQAT